MQGSVAERIFEPLIEQIKGNGGSIRGGQLVSRVEVDPATGAATAVVARNRDGEETVYQADAVIFSVGVTGEAAAGMQPGVGGGGGRPSTGCRQHRPSPAPLVISAHVHVPYIARLSNATSWSMDATPRAVCMRSRHRRPAFVLPSFCRTEYNLLLIDNDVDDAAVPLVLPSAASTVGPGAGMQKIAGGSPALASRPEFAAISNLRGIDVIATRLWFDRHAIIIRHHSPAVRICSANNAPSVSLQYANVASKVEFNSLG